MITFESTETVKEIKYPAHFKGKVSGVIVLAFDENRGIVVSDGPRSTFGVGFFVDSWQMPFNKPSFWEQVPGKTTFES